MQSSALFQGEAVHQLLGFVPRLPIGLMIKDFRGKEFVNL